MMMAITAIDTRNCLENAGPVSGRAVAKVSHWSVREAASRPEVRGRPRTTEGPGPCIIGPRPIIGWKSPNGGPTSPETTTRGSLPETAGQLLGQELLDDLRSGVALDTRRHGRRLSRKRDPERLVAQCGDDPLAPFQRRILDEPGQIGDALRGSETADRAHGLFAVGGVEPGSDGMRDDQAREQDQQGLSEQALGKKPAHCWLTAGVNM